MQEYLQEYIESPGLGGSMGYVEADSAQAALEQLMQQKPGCIEYCVFTVDRELVSEDLPPSIQWSQVGEAFAMLGSRTALPEGFLAWAQTLGYIRHNPQQEAVKALRRKVKEWAASGGAQDPRFVWLAIYRCGTGDWDIELSLTKVRPWYRC